MQDLAQGSGSSSPMLTDMYKEYFLDYASYVILERAIPAVLDGLKPVQRRILHSMKQMDDGRYHKVANIIGQTMQYHPHGDAAIGDALVHLGQKDLLIDPQGNWGDVRTGDRAAASRYIEARLTKFALDILFNPQTTEWQISYDGRKNEPIHLPAKFPLVLSQGAEGIAVGLSTKILPHNFIEILHACIKVLQNKRVKLYPDFQNGGSIDITEYNQGKRGGKVRVRAHIEIRDKKSLAITQLPYGVTTTSLIDSIVKATDKGKIKIKKIIDNTAKDVEILLDLPSGVSPEITLDALYAFTNCEISLSPNACVIVDNKPLFLSVLDILNISVEHTRELLRLELEIKKGELEEKWHFASLEKIFIEKRIYRDIEECETWEAVIKAIDKGIRKYIATPSDKKKTGESRLILNRDITEEDLVRLTEIKIKRISKFNSFKADELIQKLLDELETVNYNLKHLTDYAISHYEHLLETYSKGQERQTEIREFDTIDSRQVVAANTKLYVNRKDGFVGSGLKKDEFVTECSDIDDVISIRKNGTFSVNRIGDKIFTGKHILHVAVWKKGDDRTTYNMIYTDGNTGKSFVKRFNVTSITRDKEYHLGSKDKNCKVHYLSANPNGEAEIITITLSPNCRAKNKVLELDFSDVDIKGRVAKGVTVTKYPIRKIVKTDDGQSTLGAQHVWMDEVSGRLNNDNRGKYLGAFDTGEDILLVYDNGTYLIREPELSRKIETQGLLIAEKLKEETILTAVHFEGIKKWTMVKRFHIETTTLDTPYKFISEQRGSKLLFASTHHDPVITFTEKVKRKNEEFQSYLESVVSIKGWKAMGNKLSEQEIKNIKSVESSTFEAGDTIEFDVKDNGQGKLDI